MSVFAFAMYSGSYSLRDRMMEDPIGFFLTWATYRTWLPGDSRGWIEYRKGWHLPDPAREQESKFYMSEDACWLTPAQRSAVEKQIAETCSIRGWNSHAVNTLLSPPSRPLRKRSESI